MEDLGAEVRAVLVLPGGQRRPAEPGARRDVAAVVEEPTVAAHAASQERLLDVVGGQELLGAELERVRHGVLQGNGRSAGEARPDAGAEANGVDRKSTRLNSSH